MNEETPFFSTLIKNQFPGSRKNVARKWVWKIAQILLISEFTKYCKFVSNFLKNLLVLTGNCCKKDGSSKPNKNHCFRFFLENWVKNQIVVIFRKCLISIWNDDSVSVHTLNCCDKKSVIKRTPHPPSQPSPSHMGFVVNVILHKSAQISIA